jgi:hypothetical protein
MKLTVNISAYCDGAFLCTGQLLTATAAFRICLPPAARWTRPARPLVPENALLETDLDCVHNLDALSTSLRSAKLTYLLAEPLYVDLGQLLAGHQALNPPIKSWYGRGLSCRRESRRFRRSANIFHICIHGVPALAWGSRLRVLMVGSSRMTTMR